MVFCSRSARKQLAMLIIIKLTDDQMSQKCRQILAMDAEKLSAGLQLWQLYEELIEYVV